MRILFLPILALTVFACTQDATVLHQQNSDLVPGQGVKKSLKQHGADTFRLDLGANAFVTGNANQISVDVVVTVLDPDDKIISSFDNPARGPEYYQFITQRNGMHKIVVTPFEENAGDYMMQLTVAEALATDPARRIDQLASASMDADGPGVAIAVERDGKILYSKGFGHAELEYDSHITPQTVFHIASVSKQFTTFAIALLADQGKLSIDDDIRKYLPEMHDFGTPITIRHLAHHTSGLRDQWNLLAMAGWRLDDVITREQVLRLVSRQRELNFKPNDQHNYCNTGYTLMAEIVSRVTGKPFPEWMRENVFSPLKMNSTLFYDDHQKIVPNRAYSYYMADTVYKKSVLSYANVGATSLFTTVEDLSKWAANFENVKVGNANVMKMMETRGVLNNGDTLDYAFGQVIQKHKGLKTISHGGADAGYRSFFLRFPDQKFSISVFSNLASFNTAGLAYGIADVYLKDEWKEEPKKENAPPPAEGKKEPFDVTKVKLTDYTGRFYSNELETYYEFEVKNDTLIAHHQRHDDFKLTPASTDGFKSTVWWMGDIQFIRAAGKVNAMKVSNGRVMNLVFNKQ